MKIKVTIWLTDPQTEKLTEDVKQDLKVWIQDDALADSGCEVHQIEIEETEFED